MSDFVARVRAELDDSGIEQKLNNLTKDRNLKLNIDASEIDNAIANIEKKLTALSKVEIKISGLDASSAKKSGATYSSSLISGINKKLSNGAFEKYISNINKQYQKAINSGDAKQLNKVKQLQASMQRAYKAMQSAGKSGDINALTSNYKLFNNALTEAQNRLSTISAQSKTFADSLQIKGLDNKIASWMDSNADSAKRFGSELTGIRSKLQSALSGSGKMNIGEFEDIESKFSGITQQATKASKAQDVLSKSMKMSNSISDWMNKNVASAKQYGSELQTLQGLLKDNTDASMLKDVTSEFNQIKEKSKAAGTEISASFKQALRSGEFTDTFNEFKSQFGQLGSSAPSEAAKSMNQLDTAYRNLFSASKSGDFTQMAAAQKAFVTQTKETASVLKQAQQVQKSMEFSDSYIGRMNKQLDTNAIGASIANVEAQYKKISSLNDSRVSSVAQDIESLRQLSQAIADPSNGIQKQAQAFEQYETTLARAKNTMSEIAASNKMFADSLQVKNLDNDISSWISKNSKAIKDYGSELTALQTKLRANPNGMDIGEYNQIRTAYKNIVADATMAGKTGQTFANTFSKAFRSIQNYVGVSTIIFSAIDTAKKMFNEVKAIDSAMTELNKVSDASGSQLSQVFENSKESARDYATTLSDMISATADWSRLGYGLDQSQDLAKVAALYKNVGDNIDISTANEHLISTMQGFSMEASSAESIVDKFNEVSNNYAISSDGIGAALERSASSMSAAGNSLDETIALVTAANTVVQDPDSVGNAFKTISMRIRGAKTELEAAGEDTEGMAESTAKLKEEMMALSGVDIMQDENTFKSTYQIMDELSRKWSGLTDIQQASITELIAGKRQGNIVSSLMNNFDIARNALQSSINSEGSAMEENEKYLDSIQGRIANFQSSFQELSSNTLDSNFLKGAISGATAFLDVLSKIQDVTGGIGAFAISGGLAAFIKNFD